MKKILCVFRCKKNASDIEKVRGRNRIFDHAKQGFNPRFWFTIYPADCSTRTRIEYLL